VPGARIIKRYGNRRLYDQTRSRAVTMEDLGAAVRRGEDLRVLDGETGVDITKRVLVQIILEEQNRGALELLPIEFLRKLIALRSETLAQWIEQYLSAGAQWLNRQSGTAAATTRAFQESMEALFPWMKGPHEAKRADGDGPPADPDRDLRDEIDDLQRRLADLSGRLRR
jgi:polyhydroxyalkanoate synthesis repressor PhaR